MSHLHNLNCYSRPHKSPSPHQAAQWRDDFSSWMMTQIKRYHDTLNCSCSLFAKKYTILIYSYIYKELLAVSVVTENWFGRLSVWWNTRTSWTFWQSCSLTVRREKVELTSDCMTTKVDSYSEELICMNLGMRWVTRHEHTNVNLRICVCEFTHVCSYRLFLDVSARVVLWQRHDCSYWTEERQLLLPCLQTQGQQEKSDVNKAAGKHLIAHF